jgi:hypothetical protein
MDTLVISLHKLFNSQIRFSYPFFQLKDEIPKNGIYIIFENGEKFKEYDRIVRVGTHKGTKKLLSRLNEHFLIEDKNRSIFRKNIGRCILNMEQNPYLPLWELKTTSKADKGMNLRLLDLDFEKQLEKTISNYIQNNLSFCVFQIDTKVERLFWESKIISTLAKSRELEPSKNWLGNYSTKDKIKTFGLWQVNELFNASLTEKELEELKNIILKNGKIPNR